MHPIPCILFMTTFLTPNTFLFLVYVYQAFIYVGVYGYPYLTAGKKVMTLFKERGWTVVINDNLIRNALGLMNILIAVLCGIVPMVFIPDVSGIFL